MSQDDFRLFDASNGRLVAVSHHFGKNPYNNLDPLGISNEVQAHNNQIGEWESVCHITGYCGMPNMKIRPKTLSRHGRQYAQDPSGNMTFFSLGKESRLKSMSIRHNLAVRKGITKEPIYRLLVDMYGRTMQVVNMKGEMVAFIQKSLQTLILNAAFGQGSELLIDVAPGVDWTAIVAVAVASKQVGAHFIKDAVSNYVISPLTNAAVDAAVDATGTQAQVQAAGHTLGQGVHVVAQMQQMVNMFYH